MKNIKVVKSLQVQKNGIVSSYLTNYVYCQQGIFEYDIDQRDYLPDSNYSSGGSNEYSPYGNYERSISLQKLKHNQSDLKAKDFIRIQNETENLNRSLQDSSRLKIRNYFCMIIFDR